MGLFTLFSGAKAAKSEAALSAAAKAKNAKQAENLKLDYVQQQTRTAHHLKARNDEVVTNVLMNPKNSQLIDYAGMRVLNKKIGKIKKKNSQDGKSVPAFFDHISAPKLSNKDKIAVGKQVLETTPAVARAGAHHVIGKKSALKSQKIKEKYIDARIQQDANPITRVDDTIYTTGENPILRGEDVFYDAQPVLKKSPKTSKKHTETFYDAYHFEGDSPSPVSYEHELYDATGFFKKGTLRDEVEVSPEMFSLKMKNPELTAERKAKFKAEKSMQKADRMEAKAAAKAKKDLEKSKREAEKAAAKEAAKRDRSLFSWPFSAFA